MQCEKCKGNKTFCYTNTTQYKNRRFLCQNACHDCISQINPTGITSEHKICPTTPEKSSIHISKETFIKKEFFLSNFLKYLY
jgi:hypothetical protein